VARKLIDRHRVVLVDLPGEGGTTLPDPFSYEAAAAALEPVLASLPAESTIVVGHGAGGVIAAYATKAHPERVRGLALVDLPARFPIPVPDAQRKVFVQWMGEHYDELIARIYQAQGPDTVHGAALLAAANLVPRATMTAYLRQSLDLDAAGALKGFRKPILYVGSELRWAAERPWNELAAERGLAERDVDVHRFAGCGRWIMKDRPDSVAAAIAAFSAKTLAASPAAQR
jgi:pimeloyl-ACP methyl ester carboxylesterase